MVCRLQKYCFLLTLIVFFVTSCTNTTTTPLPPELQLPEPLASEGPTIPFRNPNLRGDAFVALEPFTDVAQIKACLALGQTVYGIDLQNSNVRETPAAAACRHFKMQKWRRGNADARYFGDGNYICDRAASVGNIVGRGDRLCCL